MKSSLRAAPFVLVVLAACSKIDSVFGNSSSSSCSGATTYTVGSTVAGTVGVHDCRGPNGFSGQLYTLTTSAQTNIKVTVVPTAFAPTVSMFTGTNTTVGESSYDGTLRAFLPAGSYQIFVYSVTGQGGAYTLTSPTTTLGGGCLSSNGSLTDSDIGYTLKGAAFSGQIIATDCGAINAKLHWYRIRLAGTDTLNTTVTVDKPAGLYLVNTTGAVVATKELTAPGTWTNTYAATADGTYTLRIESRASGSVSNLPLNYTVALK
jgi:hypothetical protein